MCVVWARRSYALYSAYFVFCVMRSVLLIHQDAAHKPADVADPQASRVQCRLTMAVPLPFYPLYE